MSLSGKTVLYIDNSVECFGQTHAPLAAVALVSLLGQILLALFYKMFIFIHDPAINDVMTTTSPLFDVSFHLIRTINLLLPLLIDSVTSARES